MALTSQQPSESPLAILLSLSLLCLAGYLWYGWVVENDRIASEVIQCMGGDSSRAAYEACIQNR